MTTRGLRKPGDYRVFLFDFDGTLVDSMPTFPFVAPEMLDEHGVRYGDDVVKSIPPLGCAGAAGYLIEPGLDRPGEEMVRILVSRAEEAYTCRVPAKTM